MDMEVSVPGSGFGEDGMSVASVEVVAGAKVKNQNEARSTQVGCFQRLFFFHKQELTVPQPVSVTDTESTTLDIGGFSDNSQSLPGMAEAGGKKAKRKKEKKKHKHKHKHKHHRDKKDKDRTNDKDKGKEQELAALSSDSSGPPSPDTRLSF